MTDKQKNRIKELVWECAEISTQNISFTNEVRTACKQNLCGKYNTSWQCPPAIGEVADLKIRYQKYSYALVFTTYHTISDSFDFEGMLDAGNKHKKIEKKITKTLRGFNYSILTSGCCSKCKKCTYPTSPCKKANSALPSLEACGIDVVALASTAGIRYYNGENSVTYFSTIFYD